MWRELDRIAENVAKVSVQVVREMVTMPNAADLTSRMLQIVGLLASVVVDARDALAQREVDQLRDLSRIKSDFLRLTTHELRRPLGRLSGYLSLIREGAFGDVPEKMKPGLQTVEAGAAEMAMLVDGLAAIARLEDQSGVLHIEPTHLGRLVAEAAASVQSEALTRGIAIEEDPPGPDILANVDPAFLRIAIINLLGNAVKYAPERSTVRVTLSASEPGPTIAVSDQGPGIEPAEIERIFNPCYRGPDAGAFGYGPGAPHRPPDCGDARRSVGRAERAWQRVDVRDHSARIATMRLSVSKCRPVKRSRGRIIQFRQASSDD